MKFHKFILIILILLTACLPPPPPNSPPDVQTASPSDPQADSAQPTEDSASTHSHSDPPHTDVLDITRLPIGDGKYTTSPQIGYVYVCNTQFSGQGPQGTGPWRNGDGTWDLTKKYIVDGSVSWPHSFTITVQGSDRVFTSNDLPDHTTGIFPIDPNDNAYQFDRNPNSISSQNVNFSVTANPTVASQPTCVGNEVGIMLSGVLIFSAFDAQGKDAPPNEVQDSCDGHPQEAGAYHYHSLSNCIEDTESGHSALVGYAFDGFGIFGYYGKDGIELTNADLDACHGHTHEIEWDGQTVEMYHYHATREFPYIIGCFKGTPSVRGLTAGQGGNGQPSDDQPQGQDGGAGSPPQDAINACFNMTERASCSFNTPLGQVVGVCMLPPIGSQLACIPTGGAP